MSLFLVSFMTSVALSAGALDLNSMRSASVQMKGIDGKETTIEEISKGKKATLVIFSCIHCPYAKAWDERMAEIGNDALTKNVGVIMINSNDPEVNKEDSYESMVSKKLAIYKFPYVVDSTSEVAKEFGATKTPDIFLFDSGGKLVYKGAVDDNADSRNDVKSHHLKTALTQVLAGKEVKPKETKSVGCGIKFRKKKKT